MASKLKTHFKQFLIGALIAAIGASAYVIAAVTFSDFTAGTTISSSAMNSKLNALKDAVNSFQTSTTAYNNSVTTTSTSVAVITKTVTIPGPGVVLAMATGYVFHNHVNGTEDNTRITVSDVAALNPVNTMGTVEARTAAGLPTTAFQGIPYAITRTFTEATGGSITLYLNCQQSSGIGGYCYGNHLTLLYIPNTLAP